MLSPQEGKAARVQLNLSQSHVAAATEINRTYISLFETGRYVLDSDALLRLRSFYESHGYEFGSASPRKPDVVPQDRGETAVNPGAAQPVGGSRLRHALSKLQDLHDSATDTGVDSKRTVAALVEARDALTKLDYPELLSIAHVAETAVDHLPTQSDFSSMPVATKEAWEDRASCTLLCDAVYGAAWLQNDPRVWAQLGKELVRNRMLTESACPKRPFFGGDAAEQGFIRRARASLAPMLVRAAEQRRGMRLSLPPSNGLASWLWSDS